MAEVLYRALARDLYGSRDEPGEHDRSRAWPRSTRSSRSTRARSAGRLAPIRPRTRVSSGPIRELFAGVPEARLRGYKPGRFSFNVKGGRCENCKGDGIIKIEMQFLPDVYVPCEVCKGKRYNREALEIHYKGRSIADVLEMTIEEALEFFSAVPDPRQAPDAQRRRPGLRPPRPAGNDAVGRRGAARQAGHRAVPAGDRQDGLRPRRADDGPALRGRREAAAGSPPARRRGQHRHRHRAQPRRDQDRGLDRGPGAGRRRPWRDVIAEGTPEHVAECRDPSTGEYLGRVLRGEPLVPLSTVTFAEAVGHLPQTPEPAPMEIIAPPEKRAAAAGTRHSTD